MSKVYVLYVDGEPLHSFVATDDDIAASVARRMINTTAYAYKGDVDILVSRGMKPFQPPKIFDDDIEIDLVCFEPLYDSFSKVESRFVINPLLEQDALNRLFFDCLPVDKKYAKIDRLAHAVAEVTENG